MTYFADLTPYTYLDDSESGPALNVGWLARGHDHPRGPVPEDFVEALAKLCATRQMNLTRGRYQCDLGGCAHPVMPTARYGDAEETLGAAEIRAEGADGTVYAAPSLIHHYVVEHQYQPPEAFVAAVRRS